MGQQTQKQAQYMLLIGGNTDQELIDAKAAIDESIKDKDAVAGKFIITDAGKPTAQRLNEKIDHRRGPK